MSDIIDNDAIRIILIILAIIALLWFLMKFIMNWDKDEIVKGSEANKSTRPSAKESSADAIKSSATATVATAKPRAKAKPKAAAKPLSNAKDDLTKIEGIGPKINELLNNAGINSFEQLGVAQVTTLKVILSDAGSRFQMHDPSTWAKQAKLAAKGAWDELEKLQDSLNGGK